MRTVALLRVSTSEQDVSAQRLAVEAWARAQDPPREVEYLTEEGVSGCAKVRPGLDEILHRVRRAGVDEVVVVALDRLGRSVAQVVCVMDELRSRGVRLVSLREGFDLGTPAGRMQAQIIAAIAEFERELIRARTRAGMDAARKRGAQIGRPCVEIPEDVLAEVHAAREAGTTWRAILSVPREFRTANGKTRKAADFTLRERYAAWCAETGRTDPGARPKRS